MNYRWRAGIVASILAGSSFLILSAADPGITFIGQGLVPGDSLDLSGLDEQPICREDDSTECIDLFPGLPTQIFAFAVDGVARGITYQPQYLPEPLYPPGQVRRALR